MKIEVASATFREATGFGSYASFARCCVFQGLYLAEGSYGFEDIMRRCSGGPCMLAAMHAVAPGPDLPFEAYFNAATHRRRSRHSCIARHFRG